MGFPVELPGGGGVEVRVPGGGGGGLHEHGQGGGLPQTPGTGHQQYAEERPQTTLDGPSKRSEFYCLFMMIILFYFTLCLYFIVVDKAYI